MPIVYYEVQLIGCSLGSGLVNRVMNLSFVKVKIIDQLTGYYTDNSTSTATVIRPEANTITHMRAKSCTSSP
jgi:hypothetical protein